ncbi:MAG: glycosyltransferase [Terriglobales bacterium]
MQADFARGWRGGQQQLLLLARALAPLGWRSVIVTPAAELATRWRAEGFEVIRPTAARRRLRHADAIHVQDGRALGWALAWRWLACLGSAAPPLLASRRVAFPLRSLAAFKWRRVNQVLAVSAFVQRDLLRAGLAPQRVTVVPDAVDVSALPDAAAARRQTRRALGIAEDRLCLSCVSALTPEKGVEDLIAALAHLRDFRPLLLLAGEGGLRGALQSAAARLGVADQLLWVAGRCTAPEAVAAGDIFVLPSRQEGLGSSLLLARALRRAVVATSAGGIPELVSSGDDGLLVPPGDAAALAAAIGQAATDAAARTRWLNAGEARLRERFTPAVMAAATAAAYATAGAAALAP